jgi:hypothetical protein
MRNRLFLLSGVLLLAAAMGDTALANATFAVTNSGASAYVINATNNPTLTLTKGQTYTFQVNTPGHPFFIATQAMNAGSPHFTTGVTNENVESGSLIFVVPASAPSTLFYQCGIHNAMSGMLTIVAAPVPATGPIALAAIAGLVLLIGIGALRRRARA